MIIINVERFAETETYYCSGLYCEYKEHTLKMLGCFNPTLGQQR